MVEMAYQSPYSQSSLPSSLIDHYNTRTGLKISIKQKIIKKEEGPMAMDNCVKGFIFGSLIGAVLGILYAPKSGKETREDICKSTEELLEKAKANYDEAREKIEKLAGHEKEVYMDKKERLKKALEAGVEVFKQEKGETPQVKV
jgi:gas vesicle protein